MTAGRRLPAGVPFRQFVLKVHSRCDLACDHCYMYEAADRSWRSLPPVMNLEIAAAVGSRIAEHAESNRIGALRIVLHGGEPLLAGVEHLRGIIEALNSQLETMDRPPMVEFLIQSNGVRLDEKFCELFAAFSVRVGISLDGDEVANDRHRRYADGRSSFAKVIAATELLRRPDYRHLYAGVLCTVDIANDPHRVYSTLAAVEPPAVDLLLPHATWDVPPPRPDGVRRPSTLADPAYARWLQVIHRVWTANGRPFGIRLFDSIESTLRGGPPLTETMGMAPSDLLAIATDGSIEQVDSMRVAFDGAWSTGLNVLSDALDTAAENPLIDARRSGLRDLAKQCRTCPIVAHCGGGLIAHRYDSSLRDSSDPVAAFRNPSVYCADLYSLVRGLRGEARPAVGRQAQQLSVREDLLDQLASGFGDASAVSRLNEAEASVNRSVLSAVGPRLERLHPTGRHAWSLILELDDVAPDAVARAIAHPFFRVSALAALHRPAEVRAEVFTGYALAAAAFAGIDTELPVSAGVEYLYLPGICRITAPRGRAAVGAGKPRDTKQWMRTLSSAGAPDVLLEDMDAARDVYGGGRPAVRLSSAAVERWRGSFAAARRLIDDAYSEYSSGLATGLRALVPVKSAPRVIQSSATHRSAYGAFAIAHPSDDAAFALLLLHEFQHLKLGAVLDLFDLCDGADTRLHYAPWRPDKRPAGALLQGVYAHVAVVDFWRRRIETAGEPAETQFARWRAAAWSVLDTLEHAGTMTELGLRFIRGMRTTLGPWMDVPVSPVALDAAHRASAEHRGKFGS